MINNQFINLSESTRNSPGGALGRRTGEEQRGGAWGRWEEEHGGGGRRVGGADNACSNHGRNKGGVSRSRTVQE